jgi:hypothetical protein
MPQHFLSAPILLDLQGDFFSGMFRLPIMAFYSKPLVDNPTACVTV